MIICKHCKNPVYYNSYFKAYYCYFCGEFGTEMDKDEDPIHIAGGCYCKECQFAKPSLHEGYLLCTGYVNPNHVKSNGFCSEGERKEEFNV